MFARSTKTRIGHSRPSFTLVELLVSISIIGVMAGMVLYTLAGAQQDSLRSKTRSTIEKINAVMLERWEGYRYRSVKLPISSEALQKRWISSRQVAQLRSLFLKDMMRMEMPDSYVDLAYTPTALNLPLTTGPVDFKSSPGREYNVLRNYFDLGQITEDAPPATEMVKPVRRPWSVRYQSAECLYAIVAHSTVGGGSALESFHASEIADIDGDGFPEFVDAWGEPIVWIRWPAGYASQLNQDYKSVPDAFDPLRTAFQWDDDTLTQKPWTLVPLILSSGSDRQFGIQHPENFFATSRNVYVPTTDAPSVGLTTNADQAADNVSSHDLLLE